MTEKTPEQLFEAIAAQLTAMTALIMALVATHPDRALLEEKFNAHFERHRVRFLYSDLSEDMGRLLEDARQGALVDIRAAH